MVGQIAEDQMALFEFDLIPSDVRCAHIVGKLNHATRQQSEPAMRTEFQAFLEHHLQAYAKSDDRFARAGRLYYKLVEAQLAQTLHGISESADPEQYQLVGFTQRFLVARHGGVDALRGESLFDAAQIAHAVINDCDIHSFASGSVPGAVATGSTARGRATAPGTVPRITNYLLWTSLPESAR